MLDMITRTLHGRACHRLWICSDLQQSRPDNARHCMTAAVDDMCALGLYLDAVCYLGDATEGADLAFLADMTQMQLEQFARLDAPVYYTLGNHDFDCNWVGGPGDPLVMPFYDAIRAQPGWRTTASLSQTHFIMDMGAYALVFLSDHGDPQGHWYTTMGELRRDADAYPYTPEYFQSISRQIARLEKPVFTFSHYAFPGGNRPTELMAHMLPLPENVRMHFYGHAHIGDTVFAGKDCYRKIACVDGAPIVQVDVASLENIRGNSIKSVILEIYPDGGAAVLFRNHSSRCWDELYVAGP